MANLKSFKVSLYPTDSGSPQKWDPSTGVVNANPKDHEAFKVVVETRNSNIFGYYQNNRSEKFGAEHDFSYGRVTLPIVFDPTVKSMTGKTATICIYDGTNISGIELGMIVWCGKLFFVQEERWRAGIEDGFVRGVTYAPLTKFIYINSIGFKSKTQSNIEPLMPVKEVKHPIDRLPRNMVRIDHWSPIKTMGTGRNAYGDTVLCELKQMTKDFAGPMSIGAGSIVACDAFIPLGNNGRHNVKAVALRPNPKTHDHGQKHSRERQKDTTTTPETGTASAEAQLA